MRARGHARAPEGAAAAVVGEVDQDARGWVIMRAPFGRTRVVDMLVGEQLPRIR